jgi:hypothetical protein
MSMIIFNGKSYNSVDEMPANERQAFEQLSGLFVDRNGNGIPDFLEGDMAQNVMTAFTSNVNYNGQTYNDVSDLPPEICNKVQGAFEKLSQLGIATKVPQKIAQGLASQPGHEPAFRSSEPVVSREYSSTLQEDTGSPLRWVLIGVGLSLCLFAVAVAIFFMLPK